MTTTNTETAGVASPQWVPQLWTRVVRACRGLAKREMLACAVILALTLGLRAALLPWLGIPQPVIHDEFSYLLAADTYAHGRLANPAHPLWQHFESFQILQQPTYASKYQPLQGLVLAFGQKFFGEPWIVVYLTTGLMCATICWMLQGWIAPELALLGALALGAVVRMWRRKQFGHAIAWALGLAILVLSRSYDAAIVGAASAAMLFWFLRKYRTPLKTISVRVALPALVVLLLCMTGVANNDYHIDTSRVVWAREMSPERDRPFLEYFHDRQVRLLEPDQSPPKLSQYPRVDEP